MTNSTGYTYTAIFFLLLIIAFVIKSLVHQRHFGKYSKLESLLKYFMIFLPMIYLFVIDLDWSFGLNFLPSQNSADLTWSVFHIGSLVVMLIFMAILLARAPIDAKSQRRYLGGRLDAVDHTIFQLGLMMVGIEIFKQLVFLNLGDGLANYQWYGLPLQFCSVPIFLYPVSPLVKNQRIKDALYSFIAIFTLVAGLSVMLVGGSVFTLNVSISIHTMLWHGTMVIVASYVMVARKLGSKWRQYVEALIVLAILVVIVQIVNVSFHFLSFKFPGLESFDGFFINPWAINQNMPVLSNIRIALQESGMHVAFVGIIFTLLYLTTFAVGGLLIFGVARFIHRQVSTKSHLNESQVKV